MTIFEMSIDSGSLPRSAIEHLSTECERHSFLGPYGITRNDIIKKIDKN